MNQTIKKGLLCYLTFYRVGVPGLGQADSREDLPKQNPRQWMNESYHKKIDPCKAEMKN